MLSVTAPDAKTVVIKLKEPIVYLLSLADAGPRPAASIIIPKETDSTLRPAQGHDRHRAVHADELHAVRGHDVQEATRTTGTTRTSPSSTRSRPDRPGVRAAAGAVQGRQHLHLTGSTGCGAAQEDVLADQEATCRTCKIYP